MTTDVKICPKCNAPIEADDVKHISECTCSGCQVAREKGLCVACGKVEEAFEEIKKDPESPTTDSTLDERAMWLLTGVAFYDTMAEHLARKDSRAGLSALLIAMKYAKLLDIYKQAQVAANN